MRYFDIKILGQRLRPIHKKLGMTQANVARSLLSKVEQGQPVLSPMVIGYIFLFADRIIINNLMGVRFDINDKDTLYDLSFGINSIIRAKMGIIQQDINNEFYSIKDLL